MMPYQCATAPVGAAVLAFGAVVAAELWMPAPDVAADPVPRVLAVAANPGLLPGSGPEQEPARIARLLARPLFSEGRRPAMGAASVEARVDLPRLDGVFVSSQARSAIFAAAGDGKPVVVGVGGSVSAFRVQAIEAGQVTMIGADGSLRLLRPGFDPKPALPPADASTPPGTASTALVHRRPRPAVVTLSAPLTAQAMPAPSWPAPPR